MPTRNRLVLTLCAVFLCMTMASTQSWINPTFTIDPGHRGAYAMVHDSARGHVLLFGGQTWTTVHTLFNDTWTYDGVQWKNITPPGTSPSPRFLSAMAHDPNRARAVLFGGHAGSIVQDTWEWDGVSWTQITVKGPIPPARHGHGMAYDPIRKNIVMFGGYIGSNKYLGDTWTYDDTTSKWIQMNPSNAPSARSNFSMVFDPTRGKTLLFGGFNNSGSLCELWEWDGTNWARVPQTTPWPPHRYSCAFGYDPVQRSMVLFGGVYMSSGNHYRNDTWRLSGRNTWTSLTISGPCPSARGYASMVYDTRRARFVLYGGTIINTSSFDDTWEFGNFMNAASLTGHGSTSPGKVRNFLIQAPRSGGLQYLMASSFGTGPIPIDTRSLGLTFDWLMMLTVYGAFPMTFQNYRGVLTAQGLANPPASFAIPPAPTFWLGLTVHTAYVTLSPSAPSGVNEISNTSSFLVK